MRIKNVKFVLPCRYYSTLAEPRHIFCTRLLPFFFIFAYNCIGDIISPSRLDRQPLTALANGFCRDIKIGEARKKPRRTVVRVSCNERNKNDGGPQGRHIGIRPRGRLHCKSRGAF